MNPIINALAFEREMEIRREVERKTRYASDWPEYKPAPAPRKKIITRVFHWVRRRTAAQSC